MCTDEMLFKLTVVFTFLMSCLLEEFGNFLTVKVAAKILERRLLDRAEKTKKDNTLLSIALLTDVGREK